MRTPERAVWPLPPRPACLPLPEPMPRPTRIRFLLKITEDVRKYAEEQGIAESEALKKGMEAKSREFVDKGAEVYSKA